MKKITILMAFMLITSYGFAQTNLISDGGFENLGTGPLTGAAPTWQSTSGGVNVQNNSANARTGDQMVNLGNDFRNIRQVFSVDANTDYTVTVYYRNNFDAVAEPDAPYLSIRENTGGNGTILENNGTPISALLDPFYDANTNVYNEATLTFNSEDNTELVLYMFKDTRATNTNPNNAFKLDDVSVVEANLSTADLRKVDLKMYPNPTSDQLNLSANTIIDQIEIYNMLGSLVMKRSILSNNSNINVSSLPKGAYILKAFSGDNMSTYKLIKE